MHEMVSEISYSLASIIIYGVCYGFYVEKRISALITRISKSEKDLYYYKKIYDDDNKKNEERFDRLFKSLEEIKQCSHAIQSDIRILKHEAKINGSHR